MWEFQQQLHIYLRTQCSGSLKEENIDQRINYEAALMPCLAFQREIGYKGT